MELLIHQQSMMSERICEELRTYGVEMDAKALRLTCSDAGAVAKMENNLSIFLNQARISAREKIGED